MNRPVVYQPDSMLRGLWSPYRTQETLSLRDYLATRPNVCFQCHDLPSLLPGIGSVPPEVVVGGVGGDGGSESLPSAYSKAAATAASPLPPPQPPNDRSTTTAPVHWSGEPLLLNLSRSTTTAPVHWSGEPRLLNLSRRPSGEDGRRPSGEDGRRPSGEDGRRPSGEDGRRPSGEDGRRPSGEDGRRPSGEDARDRRRPRSELSDILGRPADWNLSGSPVDASAHMSDGIAVRGDRGHVRIFPTAAGPQPPPANVTLDGLTTATKSARPVPAAAGYEAAATRSSGCEPSFPDFIRDTIAHFVHQSSPQARDLHDDDGEATKCDPRLTGGDVTARPPAFRSRLTSYLPASPRAPTATADGVGEAATRRPPVSRSLKGLLCGVKVDDERCCDDACTAVCSFERKRKVDQLSARAVAAVGEPVDSDSPLDLSKKHCPAPSMPLLSSLTAAAPVAPLTLVGSPVVLAKKNLHPVTSRVSDCLLRSVQKAARIASALEGVDEHDRATLVCSCWHRLLLWLLAEENFSFVVVPVTPGQGRSSPAACQQQAQNGFVSSSSASAGGGSRAGVPTVGFVQAVTAFIDKCHTLKLDRVELDLLFSITLFHLDGQHLFSSALANRLIGQTRRRLMDELLRHTTASTGGDAVAGGGCGGVERYSQLLLCLPALYAIDVRTFEVLFCERLTGPAVDMRLLLMDIIRPLL